MLCPEVLLVSGDFNFHLDDPSDADARKFMELMDTFGLLQHITTPTHVSGHTLDVIISRSSNDINVLPPKSTYYISDHCFTECPLSIPGPNMLVKEVSYRKFKQIRIWVISDRTLHHLFCAIHSGQASKNWLSVMIPLCHKSWINTPP